MNLEKYISKLYRFSTLKEVGKTGMLALSMVSVVGIIAFLFLPSSTETIELPENGSESFLTVEATHVKNDDAYFHEFMHRLKKNGDVLMLGTSESGYLDSYNYWELLNADSELKERFGILYGAGRSCERYIPSMLNHPDIWRRQKLIVIVNPAYWREDLCEFNYEYYDRYMNTEEVRRARQKSDRLEDFDVLYGPGSKGFIKAGMESLNNTIDSEIHSLFYDHLRNALGWKNEELEHFTVHPDYLDAKERGTTEQLNALRDEILPDFNTTQSYIDEGAYSMGPLVLDSKYRNTTMDYFMDLCTRLKMDVTFVLGPYNRILAEKCGQHKIVQQHEALEDQLRIQFKEAGFDFIDATDISEIPGSFIDKQHHSKYGGYLLYERIKNNWHE